MFCRPGTLCFQGCLQIASMGTPRLKASDVCKDEGSWAMLTVLFYLSWVASSAALEVSASWPAWNWGWLTWHLVCQLCNLWQPCFSRNGDLLWSLRCQFWRFHQTVQLVCCSEHGVVDLSIDIPLLLASSDYFSLSLCCLVPKWHLCLYPFPIYVFVHRCRSSFGGFCVYDSKVSL